MPPGICQFFLTAQGCRKGPACNFLHLLPNVGDVGVFTTNNDERALKRPRYEDVRPEPTGEVSTPPAQLESSAARDDSQKHPCLRVMQTCRYGDNCVFRLQDRYTCLLCLKKRPHIICDVGLEDDATRRAVECQYTADPPKEMVPTCQEWLYGSCTLLEQCSRSHYKFAKDFVRDNSFVQAAPPPMIHASFPLPNPAPVPSVGAVPSPITADLSGEFMKRVANLLNDPKIADVRVECQPVPNAEEDPAILCSSVLFAVWTSDIHAMIKERLLCGENPVILDLSDIPVGACMQAMQFMYSGHVFVNASNVEYLRTIAMRWKLSFLKAACNQYVSASKPQVNR